MVNRTSTKGANHVCLKGHADSFFLSDLMCRLAKIVSVGPCGGMYLLTEWEDKMGNVIQTKHSLVNINFCIANYNRLSVISHVVSSIK